MGTTVTGNLGLIKPDEDESIKEDLPTFAGWAAQNTINCDKVDALFRATNATYVPVWGASTTPPTLGAGGFVTGKFLCLWPRLVVAEIKIFAGGAGFLGGSGTYSLTLPAAVPAEFPTFFDAVNLGKAIVLDADNVLNSNTMAVLLNASTSLLFLRPPNGSSWTNAFPFTLAA